MRRSRISILAALGVGVAAAVPSLAAEQSVQVCCAVGTGTNTFTPKTVTIDPGDTVTWRNEPGGYHNVKFDDGSFEQPADPSLDAWTVSRQFTTPGEYRYYCEQHGSKGGVGMSGTVIVRGATTPPPSGDTTAPDIDSLRVSPATFCNKKSKTCRKTGARIRFTLSEDATVEATILRRDSGDVVKRFSITGRKGKNSKSYSGSGLPLGKYRVEMSATDAAGNQSKPARASFKIAKRRG